MLDRYRKEEKDRFHQLIAERYSVKKAAQILEDEFPNVKPYEISRFYYYVKSEEGKKGIEEALSVLREEAKTESYAHRGSRVHSLVEIAEGLLQKLRTYNEAQVGSKEYLSVSGEFRGVLRDIRSEVEVLGIEDGTALDIFSSFVNLAKSDRGIPQFVLKNWEDEEASETN